MLSGFVVLSQNNQLVVEGTIIDESGLTIPYAAVSVQGKTVGTTSTDEGTFNLILTKEHESDSLVISSMGYETKKIKIDEYLILEDFNIVLVEIVTTLDEAKVMYAKDFVEEAINRLKENTISETHLLNILYRRASIEDYKAKFLVEHYMKILDKGPSASTFKKLEVVEARKSADYRILKRKQIMHAINYMIDHNPLRDKNSLKNYSWERIGESSYDGEEIVIVEGRNEKSNFVKLYIGLDTYKVYRINTSFSNALFVYQKNAEGKLYLNYHSREWNKPKKRALEPSTIRALGKNAPTSVLVAYRQEVYVLGLETDKDMFDIKPRESHDIDMGDLVIEYNPEFWKNISLPPDTEFFKKIKLELTEIFGVPLEQQFQYVNNSK